MVKTRKMSASFFLALILLICLNRIVSAEEMTEITVHPSETIRDNELGFENTGETTFYGVYAVASGRAADWVSPTTLHFGTVYPGEEVWETYTIKVPEDAKVRRYYLIWKFYSEEGYHPPLSVDHVIHVCYPIVCWIWIVISAIATPGIVVGASFMRNRYLKKLLYIIAVLIIIASMFYAYILYACIPF